MITQFLKWIFLRLCSNEHAKFLRALRKPGDAQSRLLAEILKAHAQTEYGKSLGIHAGVSADEFRAAVPLSSFDLGDLSSWVERQRKSQGAGILSPGGARLFEKTSGSSGRFKLIPYNASLKKSFERYFQIWAFDLLTRGPKFKSLRTFISISAGFRTEEEVEGGIGLEDDSEYISPILRRVFKRFLSVPFHLKNIPDPELFRDSLAAYLLNDSDLEIISIWHPSFFEVLWQHVLLHRIRVAKLVRSKKTGSYSHVASLLEGDKKLEPADFWPKLKLISAWNSAGSKLAASRLQKLFPDIFFQGKGLLSTEAPMTVPLLGVGNVPFITEVLFEFMDNTGKFFWMDELTSDEVYQLVISQKGGLLRYEINDQVKVTGFTEAGCPFLEFVGRAGEVSDLVGEKLTSEFIARSEEDFTHAFGQISYCLMPSSQFETAGYTLCLDVSESLRPDLERWWEERLMSSFHYAYARKLKQLRPLESVLTRDLTRKQLGFYETVKKMKSGDVKLKAFIYKLEDAHALAAYLQAAT